MLGGAISTSQVRAVVKAGTQAVVVQWTPLAPPDPVPTEPPAPVLVVPPVPLMLMEPPDLPAQAWSASAAKKSRHSLRFGFFMARPTTRAQDRR
jgi:hypothetical protein